jgi:glutathione S-transferase
VQLYHNNMSTCAQKVRLVLREKRLAPEETHLNLRAGEQNRPEYLQLNPAGVVPTLVDRSQVIVESTIICEYLDDAYPDPPLRPRDAVARAHMRWWTQQPDSGLHQAVGLTSVGIAFRHQLLARGPEHLAQYLAGRPDPVQRERLRVLVEQGLAAPGVSEAIRRYARFIRQMTQQLRHSRWLAGKSFSLADTMALPYVLRLEHLGLDWWWNEAGRGHGELQGWLERCRARTSYAAITNYLDPDYLEVMAQKGAEAAQQVREILH